MGWIREYAIHVYAYDLTDEQTSAMFDRVADAAHELDEEVTVTGGAVEPSRRVTIGPKDSVTQVSDLPPLRPRV